MSPLSWDDFRLIKAIVDSSGLTGAAAYLHVNHSTVFRRLGQIEEAVGLPLFERRKTGYVATPAGEEMAALAARMDDDVSAFARRIAGRLQGESTPPDIRRRLLQGTRDSRP
jgi:DNA-binding transcriptional LysR family regulator